MELVLENCPDYKWVKTAFTVISDHYGITNAPWVVRVRVEPADDSDSGGHTAHDPKLGKEALIVLKETSEPFKRRQVVLRGKAYEAHSMLEVFCHEMVHIKQHVKDGLYGDQKRGGQWYKGIFFPGALTDFLEATIGPRHGSPWEEEAYGDMFKLADKVKRHL